MVTRLVLNQWENWLLPGSPSNSQLLHSDPSDRILVCPPHLGQGYFQEILLRDDLTLFLYDCTLHQAVAIDTPDEPDCLEFEFQLAGFDAGYSAVSACFGLKNFWVQPPQKQFFRVEVCFKRSTLVSYFQAFLERLSPQTRNIAERFMQLISRYQGGNSILTAAGLLNQSSQDAIAPLANITIEQLLTDAFYTEMIAIDHAIRNPMTLAMKQAIGQILSCPYQGATRRTYLECKALELVDLHLEAMIQPRLSEADLSCIYQAGAILRNQVANPPTVEMLAHQVFTNRLKLNQGFREVYGTTPFGYLRDSRLRQAKRLLMTSDLSVVEVAATVGYTCRSKFAMAFRQKFGINPKAFQMQAWQCAS